MSSNREEEVPVQGDRSDPSTYKSVANRSTGRQVSSAAQICNALWRMLPAVGELAIDFYEHGSLPPEWGNEVDSRT